ncbi:MAG: SPOR domain-containing protein [Noviherbaspirillum sp.]
MSSHGNRQSGGTVLGLIIGLIIGLAIAVGVAMTIKNTPIPFSNKAPRQGKAPDPAAGQMGDPNKPLYGNRDAARQAARSAPARSEEERVEALLQGQAPAAPGAVPAVPAIPPAPPVPAQAARTPEPLSSAPQPARVSPGGTAPAGNPDERYTYFLQAGAFLERSDAENTKARLALMGLSANIAERKSDNGTLYRVRIGPFAQLDAMNRVRGKLTDNGVDVAVVRVPK